MELTNLAQFWVFHPICFSVHWVSHGLLVLRVLVYPVLVWQHLVSHDQVWHPTGAESQVWHQVSHHLCVVLVFHPIVHEMECVMGWLPQRHPTLILFSMLLRVWNHPQSGPSVGASSELVLLLRFPFSLEHFH